MKKSFKELMQDCPKHDHAYVLYKHRWNRVEEHELRYLCLLVAKGEISSLKIKYMDGTITHITEKGYLDEITGNIFCLCGKIHREFIQLKNN